MNGRPTVSQFFISSTTEYIVITEPKHGLTVIKDEHWNIAVPFWADWRHCRLLFLSIALSRARSRGRLSPIVLSLVASEYKESLSPSFQLSLRERIAHQAPARLGFVWSIGYLTADHDRLSFDNSGVSSIEGNIDCTCSECFSIRWAEQGFFSFFFFENVCSYAYVQNRKERNVRWWNQCTMMHSFVTENKCRLLDRQRNVVRRFSWRSCCAKRILRYTLLCHSTCCMSCGVRVLQCGEEQCLMEILLI